MAKKRPESLNILGIDYRIDYCDKPSEVDVFKRESLWGQVDPWTKTIRIYDKGNSDEDVWQTIFHEMLEAFKINLHLACFEGERGHEELDLVAMAINDVLFRNNLIKLEE